MKFQMKTLALAVLGLASFGVAGSAMAACSNPTPFAAWSSWNGTANSGAAFGGKTVAADGLHSTSCAMASSINAGAGNGAQGVVFDNSPTKEQTYRFRFYVDPTAVAGSLDSSFKTSFIFTATSGSVHGSTSRVGQILLIGSGANASIRPFAACTAAGSGTTILGNLCHSTDVSLGTAPYTGGVRVEGQIIIGAAGTGKMNVWVGSNTGTPDAVINVDNAAWGGADGVEQATMGLFKTTPNFRSANATKVVLFDEFDSRRQTPIGP